MRRTLCVIASLSLVSTLSAVSQSPRIRTEPGAQAQSASPLSAALSATLARYNFSGTALVRSAHGQIIQQSTGWEDIEHGVRASADTLYQTGSFSKWVASVIVLRQVDAGKLSLHTPISTYLKDYPAAGGSRVTLHHLLSHTSGVPNQMAAAFTRDSKMADYAAISTQQAVASYASGDLAFEPGARFDYSHSNWLLVEYILEITTGRTYRQLVQTQLTAPLHLQHSGILPADFATLPHAARPYRTLTPTPEQVPAERVTPFPEFVGPFGGFYSSAPDMLRLLDGVVDRNILSPASRKSLWTVNVPAENYAYGGRVQNVAVNGHTGLALRDNNSNGAYKSFLFRADDGTTILLFNNTTMNQEHLNQIADDLLQVLYPATK